MGRFESLVILYGSNVAIAKFTATVASGNWPGRDHTANSVVFLRVAELGFDEAATPLRFPNRGQGKSALDQLRIRLR